MSARTHAPRTLAVVGLGCVGKTALCSQFVNARFPEVYHPTATETLRKTCVVDDEQETVDILCLAASDIGQGAVCDNDLSLADGFALVFALDSRASFDALPRIMDVILAAKNAAHVPAIVIGNKADANTVRRISEDDARALAAQLRCRYIETSAALRHNVDEAFYCLLREVCAAAPRSKAQSKRSSKASLPKETANARASFGSASAAPGIAAHAAPRPQTDSHPRGQESSCVVS